MKVGGVILSNSQYETSHYSYHSMRKSEQRAFVDLAQCALEDFQMICRNIFLMFRLTFGSLRSKAKVYFSIQKRMQFTVIYGKYGDVWWVMHALIIHSEIVLRRFTELMGIQTLRWPYLQFRRLSILFGAIFWSKWLLFFFLRNGHP